MAILLPHQEELWKEAVKSIKYHLLWVFGLTILTFEEYNTISAKIEAIINSHSLVPLSSVLSSVLTPGHFLIRTPLTAVTVNDVSVVPINRLKRRQRIQAFTQLIWRRLSRNYLHILKKRKMEQTKGKPENWRKRQSWSKKTPSLWYELYPSNLEVTTLSEWSSSAQKMDILQGLLWRFSLFHWTKSF